MSTYLQTTTPSANLTWPPSKNIKHPPSHHSARCRLSQADGVLYSPIMTRWKTSRGLITHGKAIIISSLESVMGSRISLLNSIAKLRTHVRKLIPLAIIQTRLRRESVNCSKRPNPRVGLAAHSCLVIMSGTVKQCHNILHSRRQREWSLDQSDKSCWIKIIKSPPDKILIMRKPVWMISNRVSLSLAVSRDQSSSQRKPRTSTKCSRLHTRPNTKQMIKKEPRYGIKNSQLIWRRG